MNEQQEERNDFVFSLIGGTPPISFVKPTFKAKWATTKKADSWVQKPFLHPARSDTLVLNHWEKQSNQDDEGYHFAKFNRVIDVVEYTDDDYEKHLTDTDWTKDETDYLFRLCRLYDLRFPVIADRYDYDTSRTMEDIKDRYYAVNRKLIKSRSSSGGLTNGHHPTSSENRHTLLQQYSYDKSKETERKQALIGLYARTKEQIQEEQLLFLEAKRMEENKELLTTQRDQLYSTLHLEQAQQIPSTPLTPLTSSYLPPPPLSAASTSSSSSSHLASPSNGSSSATPMANPGGIGITGGTSSATQDQKKKKKDENIKKARRISTSSSSVEDLLPPPPERKEKLIPGPYVRSQKLPGIKAGVQPRALRTMADFGIGARPIMPTEAVCYKYEHFQNSVVALLELKKVAEKMDIDTKTKSSGPAGRKHSLSVSNASSNRSAADRRRKVG